MTWYEGLRLEADSCRFSVDENEKRYLDDDTEGVFGAGI